MISLFPQMAHNTVQPLLDRLDNGNPDHVYDADEVRELLAACKLVGAMIDHVWALIEEILHRGIENRQLQAVIAGFPEIVEQIRTVAYSKVRTVAASAVLHGDDRRASLDAMDDLIARAEMLSKKLASLGQLLASPPPQIDLDTILGHEDYEDVQQILERLKTGGDV